jgi:hypothetical protein
MCHLVITVEDRPRTTSYTRPDALLQPEESRNPPYAAVVLPKVGVNLPSGHNPVIANRYQQRRRANDILVNPDRFSGVAGAVYVRQPVLHFKHRPCLVERHPNLNPIEACLQAVGSQRHENQANDDERHNSYGKASGPQQASADSHRWRSGRLRFHRLREV